MGFHPLAYGYYFWPTGPTTRRSEKEKLVSGVCKLIWSLELERDKIEEMKVDGAVSRIPQVFCVFGRTWVKQQCFSDALLVFLLKVHSVAGERAGRTHRVWWYRWHWMGPTVKDSPQLFHISTPADPYQIRFPIMDSYDHICDAVCCSTYIQKARSGR